MSAAALWTSARDLWRRLHERTRDYLANDDPLAAEANSGAFLVWGNQPFYPIYVWLLVGNDAWPSLLTWLSTPLFVAVPIVARRNPLAGRSLFVLAGVANTLLSTKAFGTDTQVAWFLLPCFVLAVGYFRRSEIWSATGLTLVTLVAGIAASELGRPLQVYSEAQARSLSHLNLWSVTVLTIYLVYAAIRARRRANA